MRDYIIEDVMSTYWGVFLFENNLGHLKFVLATLGDKSDKNGEKTKVLVHSERQNSPDLFMLFNNHGLINLSEGKKINTSEPYSEIDLVNSDNQLVAENLTKLFIRFMMIHSGTPYLKDTLKYRTRKIEEIKNEIITCDQEIVELLNIQKTSDSEKFKAAQQKIAALSKRVEILSNYYDYNKEIYNHINVLIPESHAFPLETKPQNNDEKV